MRQQVWRDWIPWSVGGLALVVSLVGIGRPGLWFDEVATLAATTRSWSALGRMLADVDAVHALYYAFMHVWLDVFGYSPALLRVPSALAVAATAVVVAVLARCQWGRGAGLVAGVTFVVVPRVVWMAIEARSFAVATFLFTLAVFFLIRGLTDSRLRYWIGYALALALASATFFYCFLALPAIVAGAAWQAWRSRRDLVRLAVFTLLGVAPALPVAVAAVTQRGQVAWIEKVGPGEVIGLPRVFLGGFLGNLFSMSQIMLSSVVLVVSVALALWAYAGRRGDQAAGQPGPIRPGPMAVIVLGWIVTPALLLLAAGTVLPLYDPKYAAISAPALALLFGGGVAGRRSWRVPVALVLMTVLGVQYWTAIRQPDAKGDILAVARTVEGVARPGDALWVQHDSLARVARYAYPAAFDGLRDLTLDRDLESSDSLWETEIPVTEAGPRLNGVSRIVGISRQGADAAPEIAVLESHGYRVSTVSDHGDYRVWILDR